MDMVNQGLTGDPADDPKPGDDGYDTGNTDVRRTTFSGIFASLDLSAIGPKIKNIKSGDVEKLIRQLRHEYKASNQARLGMIRSAVSVKRASDFPSVVAYSEWLETQYELLTVGGDVYNEDQRKHTLLNGFPPSWGTLRTALTAQPDLHVGPAQGCDRGVC